MTIKPILELIDWLLSKCSKRRKVEPKRPNILLIDDNENDRELFLRALEAIGMTAIVAHNAEEAQGLLRKNGYDFVFLDMRLTYMPGWEMIHVIWDNCIGCHVVLMPGEISDIGKIKNPKKAFTVIPKSALKVKVLKELMGRLR